MFPEGYFAGRYFPPEYFAEFGATMQGPARDRDVLRAIAAALGATSVFEAVLPNQAIKDVRVGADKSAVVAIRRTGWTEVNEADAAFLVRTVTYDLGLAIRGEDPETRGDALELLEEFAINALGADPSFGGVCIRHKSVIARGVDDTTARHPEQRVALKGTFAYVVDGYNSHNTSA